MLFVLAGTKAELRAVDDELVVRSVNLSGGDQLVIAWLWSGWTRIHALSQMFEYSKDKFRIGDIFIVSCEVVVLGLVTHVVSLR